MKKVLHSSLNGLVKIKMAINFDEYASAMLGLNVTELREKVKNDPVCDALLRSLVNAMKRNQELELKLQLCKNGRE